MKTARLVLVALLVSACEFRFEAKTHSRCGRDTTLVLASEGGGQTTSVRLTPVCEGGTAHMRDGHSVNR